MKTEFSEKSLLQIDEESFVLAIRTNSKIPIIV